MGLNYKPSRQGRYLGSPEQSWIITRAVRYGTCMNSPTTHPACVVPKGTNISPFINRPTKMQSLTGLVIPDNRRRYLRILNTGIIRLCCYLIQQLAL